MFQTLKAIHFPSPDQARVFPVLLASGSQARYGENAGVRFATLMRLLCERNGGAFVALNSLTP
ncbi:MAG: hypothetical protein PVJ73_04685 [Acidobacteriota bacterium]